MTKKGQEDAFASAIKYDQGSKPRLVARGSGELAQQIEATARQHNVPVLEDFVLSNQLEAIPLTDDIPETVYFALASLFGYILEVEGVHYGEWIPADKNIN